MRIESLGEKKEEQAEEQDKPTEVAEATKEEKHKNDEVAKPKVSEE